MSLRSRITLFHDIISPYSWAGFEYLTRYQHNVFKTTDVNIQPVFLAGIMMGSKNKPPGIVPAKMSFMGRDLKYKKIYDKIPFNPLEDAATKLFKKGSVDAQRFLVAAKNDLPSDKLENVMRHFSYANWSLDLDITDKQILYQAAVEKAGLEKEKFEEFWELRSTDEIKNQLKANTQEALDLGCFGCPYFLIEDKKGDKHRIFGSDRMELICTLIEEEYKGPLAEFSKCDF